MKDPQGSETYGKNDGKGGELWQSAIQNRLYIYVSLHQHWPLQTPAISSLSPSSLAFLPIMYIKHQMQNKKNNLIFLFKLILFECVR